MHIQLSKPLHKLPNNVPNTKHAIIISTEWWEPLDCFYKHLACSIDFEQAPQPRHPQQFQTTFMDLAIASDDRAPLIYGVIGTHLALLGAAMVFVAVMTIRALGGEYSTKDREGIYAAAMFWYVTVFLYMVVWFTIYITK